MHKTGSTAVQANLASIGNSVGWRYIALGNGSNMSQTVHTMFAAAPHKYHWFVKQGKTEEEVRRKGRRLRAKFARVIRRSKEENLIISGEGISLIERSGIEALRDFLLPLCDEIQIIGYVRPPMGFMVSAFQQKVKHGNGTFNFADMSPRYTRRFKKFDEVFGRENVKLVKFDPTTFPNKCIVADFCKRINIELPDGVSIKRVNESLSREACGILYAYRKFGPGYGFGAGVITENRGLIAPLIAMGGSKFKVLRSDAMFELESKKKDIRWMENRLGVSLDEVTEEEVGGEVACEEDLLTIKRSSCEDFAERFSKTHDLIISPDQIPTGDPVDPRRVAEFVEYCRSLYRARIAEQQGRGMENSAGKKPDINLQRAKKKRCWIHIGMHKTGSTSVQVNLAAAESPGDWRLLKVGGRPNMGLALYGMFATEPHKFHLFAKKGLTADEVAEKGARNRAKLRKVIKNSTAETIIISGEAASIIDKQGIQAMRDFLEPLFDEIRIIGYVRPPLSFKLSIFQQHLKYSPCPLDFAKIRPTYRKKFEKFDEVFGRENVTLRKFDPSVFSHGCIVADFCEQIGIEALDPASIQRVNESLGREACGILYAYRKFGPGVPMGKDFVRENNRIVSALLAIPGRKFKVSTALITAGIERSRKEINWVEERMGDSLDERISENGEEVTSESDLLTIKRTSCEEFAMKYEEIHGGKIPRERIPEGDPVDPVKVAELVEFCRLLPPMKQGIGGETEVEGSFKKLVKRIFGTSGKKP